MPEEKCIIVGCDNTDVLSAVLYGMKSPGFLHTVVSAARVSDLINIAKTMEPDLIILCFQNNQHVLNDLDTFVKKPQVPVICLARRKDSEALSWNSNCIVFSYALEHIHQKDYLGSRINSVFLLRQETPKKNLHASFVDAAMERPRKNTDDLSRYIMELDQKVEVLMKVKDRIADLYPRVDDPTRTELTSIVNSIRQSANDNKLWEDFKLYFEKTNPDFLYLLVQRHPGLTPKDLKYCCYLKMNMANDDIRTLLGINQESVRTHKYRLKKKLVLPKEQDLRSYLRSVGRA